MSTTSTQSPAPVKRSFTAAASEYVNDRTGIAVAIKGLGRKAFPDHWSFLLGEVALYSFVVILISGTFLTFFFQASMVEVEYDGSFVPLKGVEMSAAMASTLDISFDIRGGLFVRQMHHWAALLFIAAIGLHMLRIFFTGAFRKPREINWVFGFVLFILALAEGFTGYSLPDDLLSGNGLRIIDGMVKGIPLIGTWTSFLLFGGEFPGTAIVGRLYTLHILLLPALLAALILIHVGYVFIHKHTQFAAPGREPTNSVGPPVLPIYAAKAGGFLFLVWGVISLIAATFTINPIWVYGPYDPSPVSAGTQPDWYIGFADGALRLIPPGWEFVWLDRTWSFNILVPLIAIGVFLILVRRLPVHRGVGEGRSPRAPHRRPAAKRADAYRDRCGGCHVLRRPLGGGELRHPGDTLLAHVGGCDPYAAGDGDPRPVRRVLHHEACLPRPAEEGPGDRAARLRVGPHREAAGRRIHRGAPAAQRVRPVEARELRELRAAHDPSEFAWQDHRLAAHARRPLTVVLRRPHRTGLEG